MEEKKKNDIESVTGFAGLKRYLEEIYEKPASEIELEEIALYDLDFKGSEQETVSRSSQEQKKSTDRGSEEDIRFDEDDTDPFSVDIFSDFRF